MIILAMACLGRTENLKKSLEEALMELRDLKSERFGNHLTLQFMNNRMNVWNVPYILSMVFCIEIPTIV